MQSSSWRSALLDSLIPTSRSQGVTCQVGILSNLHSRTIVFVNMGRWIKECTCSIVSQREYSDSFYLKKKEGNKISDCSSL